MKKLFTLAILIAVAALPISAKAEQKAQGSGPSPYTECGIGAALFQDVHWAAATSNVIWDLGSTAITSALSSPETCNAKKVKTAKLILETLPQLEKDVAMGEGTYVTALMSTAGCDASRQDQVVSEMRNNYKTSVTADDYASQSKIDRATLMYNNAKTAMSNAQCNVIL